MGATHAVSREVQTIVWPAIFLDKCADENTALVPSARTNLALRRQRGTSTPQEAHLLPRWTNDTTPGVCRDPAQIDQHVETGHDHLNVCPMLVTRTGSVFA